MATALLSSVLFILIQLLMVSGCTSLSEMGPPKSGDTLSSGFPLSKVSREELYDLALQELNDEGITIVSNNPSDGVILGTIAPDRIRGTEGTSALTIGRKLASGGLLVRVDVTKPDMGESYVHINVKKSSAMLPGDPYSLQREFTDGLRIRVGRYMDSKPLESKKIVSDVVDQPPVLRSGQKQARHGYAVLIGVESYRDLPKVDFARRDVELVREYLLKAGYPEDNIIVRTNERASRSDFESYLEQWLERNVEKGSDVFVYYAGHGSPHPKSGQPFLVPYDGDPAFLDTTAYPVERLYKTLAKLPADHLVVVLDSCFSGTGGRSVVAKGSRPVGLVVGNPTIPAAEGKKLVVFSASQNNQMSSAFPEKQHGLFTYFFLKAFHGDADVDHDGTVSIGELDEYVRVQVQRQSRRLNAEQTPQLITSPDGRAEMLKRSVFDLSTEPPRP
jgi:hypothetical protein